MTDTRLEFRVAMFDRAGEYLGTQNIIVPKWRGMPEQMVGVFEGVAHEFVYLAHHQKLLIFVERPW